MLEAIFQEDPQRRLLLPKRFLEKLVVARREWHAHVAKYPCGLEPNVVRTGTNEFFFGVKPEVKQTSSGKEYIFGRSKSTYPLLSKRDRPKNK